MKTKTILIADDDATLIQAMSMRLEQLGFSTLGTSDAMHALHLAREIQPDLIILDVGMPGGNGMAVREMLATDPQQAQIPIVIHTGRSDELTKSRCEDLGALYVLKAPGAWNEIKKIVRRVFDADRENSAVSSEDVSDSRPPQSYDTSARQNHDRPQTAEPANPTPDIASVEPAEDSTAAVDSRVIAGVQCSRA